MTIIVNIAGAKAKLSALIEAAERGEEVILARGRTVCSSWPCHCRGDTARQFS
jgi:antitoxin (DNA-binding transcriptional repressor) of toxin-antitoxin stability system